MTSTQLLADAFAFSTPPIEQTVIDGGAHCTITGEPITHGYRCMQKGIVPDALSDFNGLFGGNPHGWISESAARCLTSDWNLGSRLVLADGVDIVGHHILINAEQAEKQGRPCWSRLVRAIWPRCQGQECLVILTTDVKKRSWNRARVGTLGAHTPILVHAPEWNVFEVVYVDWSRLLTVLDCVEALYALGFSKAGIAESLTAEWKAMQRVGAADTLKLEAWCRTARHWPEFLPALIMAQKTADTHPSLNIFDL